MPMGELEVMIGKFKRDLFATTRSVKEEVPSNRWPRQCLSWSTKNISGKAKGFPNITGTEVNEYAGSKGDLVIYKRIGQQLTSLEHLKVI